jgi:hypothetical protein
MKNQFFICAIGKEVVFEFQNDYVSLFEKSHGIDIWVNLQIELTAEILQKYEKIEMNNYFGLKKEEEILNLKRQLNISIESMKKIDDYRIEINNKIITFSIKVSKIIEFDTLIIVMIRETKEVPNNVIAYNLNGEIEWYINDIIQAKVPRGFDEIEKQSDGVLTAFYELGIIFDIDITNRKVIKKVYSR